LERSPSAPRLTPQQRNEARRFNILIDTLYEARTLLIASAEARRQVEFPHWVMG
jgi:predicted ATPase